MPIALRPRWVVKKYMLSARPAPTWHMSNDRSTRRRPPREPIVDQMRNAVITTTSRAPTAVVTREKVSVE